MKRTLALIALSALGFSLHAASLPTPATGIMPTNAPTDGQFPMATGNRAKWVDLPGGAPEGVITQNHSAPVTLNAPLTAQGFTNTGTMQFIIGAVSTIHFSNGEVMRTNTVAPFDWIFWGTNGLTMWGTNNVTNGFINAVTGAGRFGNGPGDTTINFLPRDANPRIAAPRLDANFFNSAQPTATFGIGGSVRWRINAQNNWEPTQANTGITNAAFIHVTNSITVSNSVKVAANYNVSNFTPEAGLLKIAVSNSALFSITAAGTNSLAGPTRVDTSDLQFLHETTGTYKNDSGRWMHLSVVVAPGQSVGSGSIYLEIDNNDDWNFETIREAQCLPGSSDGIRQILSGWIAPDANYQITLDDELDTGSILPNSSQRVYF